MDRQCDTAKEGAETPAAIDAWKLPLIVALIVVPVAIAFAVGPLWVGFLIGVLILLGIVIGVGRSTRNDPIELELPKDGGAAGTLLVLIGEPDPNAHGERLAAEVGGEDAFVVVPATGSAVARWATTPIDARRRAKERLDNAISQLRARRSRDSGQGAAVNADGLDGLVGDADAVTSVEDALRVFPAHRVVFAVAAGAESEVPAAELDRRLTLPYRVVTL